MNNWQEYLAGTDPTNPLDALRIGRIVFATEALRVDFDSKMHRVYAVEAADSLSGTPEWKAVVDNLDGTGSPMSVPIPDGGGARFLRLRVR